jgi:hypothetical protein
MAGEHGSAVSKSIDPRTMPGLGVWQIMFLRSSVRWLAMLVAVAWMAPAVARAELVSVTVEGATEEARGFTAVYNHAPGTPVWAVRGSLVRIYRVNAPAGTIRINAVLNPNRNLNDCSDDPAGCARIAQGPNSQQSLRLYAGGSTTTLRSAGPRPPDQPVEMEPYDFAYTADGIGERVVVLSTEPYAGVCSLTGTTCGKIEGFLVFLLRVSPRLETGLVRPFLVQGPPQYRRFQGPVQGLSPLTQVTSVLIDGVAMTPVQSSESPGSGQWNRYHIAAPLDPITPSDAIYPFGETTSVDSFLGCGTAGCGMGGVTLGLPAGLGPGLHRLTLQGSRWPNATYEHYTFYGGPLPTAPSPGEPEGSAELNAEEDFIVVDPKISVSPSQAEPGSTITVTGTGFAPESDIPVRFGVQCCGVREPLGTARTDVTGAFTLQATLPAAPFASVWSPSVPPGTTTAGAILANVGDAGFLLKYGLPPVDYSGAITFVKPGATPSTTTTTLPGGGAGPPDGLDPPECAATPLPARAVKKVDSADQTLAAVEQLIAEEAARKKIRKLIGKADTGLITARQLVNRAWRKGVIPESCAAPVIDFIEDLRARAQEARDSLKR